MAVKSIKTRKRDPAKYLRVLTLYLGESLDLKKVQENIKRYSYLTRENPLVIRLLDHQYVVLTKFGAVSFWNVPSSLRRQVINELKPFLTKSREEYDYSDTIEIFVGGETERLTFERVYLREIDSRKMQIISFVSCQSVALERYEDEIEELLGSLGHVIERLKAGKWANLSQSSVLQQIGKGMAIKQSAIAHLALFDKPDLTWEREEIEKLYDGMHSEYELQDRFDILNEKISFMTENNGTLLEFLTGRREQRLEWIIIIIIAFETALVFLDIF